MNLRTLLFLLLLANTATAQAIRAIKNTPARALAAHQEFTAADTVVALHSLFKNRRTIGGWLVGGSAGVVAITGFGTLASDNGHGNSGYFNPGAGGASLLMGIGLAPLWVPGTITLLRFTKKREQAAIAEYESTRKLPRYLQKKLAYRFTRLDYRFARANHQ